MEEDRIVLESIRGIVNSKMAERSLPLVATLRELKKACPEISSGIVLPSVRQLERAGLVRTGRTINDLYVVLTDKEEEK